jgi:hypothetical protein
MAKEKRSFGRRFSQFFSKLFWHLNKQPTPTYPSTNQKRSSLLSSSKRTTKKHDFKSLQRRSSVNRSYIRSQYPPLYRTCSMRERTSTLTSIKEE